MPSRHVRLELYAIHGHLESGPIDYVHLFRSVSGQLSSFHFEEGARRVAVGRAAYIGRYLFLVAYTGYADKSILFFDINAREELHTPNEPGRFQARKTHALFDPQSRLLLIETGKGRLRAEDLADAIESLGRKIAGLETLELSFNPVPETEFIRQIDQLERIQSASVSLARPNVDWTERQHQLTEVAEESDARVLDLGVRAKRGRSLAKNAGLVDFIKRFAAQPLSILKRVSITGSREDDAGLITLNLNKHIEHLDATVPTDPVTGQASENDLMQRMESFMRTKEGSNAPAGQ